MSGDQLNPFSEAAIERQRALAEKEARGEKIGWTDLIGISEPNPDLPRLPERGHRLGRDVHPSAPPRRPAPRDDRVVTG